MEQRPLFHVKQREPISDPAIRATPEEVHAPTVRVQMPVRPGVGDRGIGPETPPATCYPLPASPARRS